MKPQFAEFYDFFAANQVEAEKRSDFVASFLKDRYASLIEVGAGTGELAFLLADEGHSVFCFEPADSMHAIFMDRLRARKDLQSYVSLFPCYLEYLNSPLIVDAIYAFSVFSHLDTPQRKSLLEATRKHLKLGGVLLFNCSQSTAQRSDQQRSLVQEKKVGDIVYKHFASSQALSENQREILFEYEIHYGTQLLKSYKEHFKLHLDTFESVKSLLESTGFKVEQAYSGFDKKPFQEYDPGFVIKAT